MPHNNTWMPRAWARSIIAAILRSTVLTGTPLSPSLMPMARMTTFVPGTIVPSKRRTASLVVSPVTPALTTR